MANRQDYHLQSFHFFKALQYPIALTFHLRKRNFYTENAHSSYFSFIIVLQKRSALLNLSTNRALQKTLSYILALWRSQYNPWKENKTLCGMLSTVDGFPPSFPLPAVINKHQSKVMLYKKDNKTEHSRLHH